MTRYISIKFNRNIIAIILAFLLLLIFTGDQTAAHELEVPGDEQASIEQSEPAIGLAAGNTFVVNSSGTASDKKPGDGDCYTGGTAPNGDAECTLRAAIQESNASSGKDTINFNVRNSDGSCPSLVTINTPPTLVIDDSTNAGVTIDGYTQCGASQNNQSIQGNAVIKVEIRGPQTSGSVGINIKSSNNTIKGLAIYRSSRNLQIIGDNSPVNNSPASNNTIQGNFIGNNAALSCCNYGNGLVIVENADYNLIGGVANRERNILVGGNGDLISIEDKSDFNVVIGNYIGVKQDGKTKASNGSSGFDIQHGVAYNWIGASPPGWVTGSTSSALGWPPAGAEWPPAGFTFGDPVPSPDPNENYDSSERNVISGNNKDGIEISHQTGTRYNYIVNNYIGVSANGNVAVGNGEYGITVEDTPNHNFIYNNVIVNNKRSGIRLQGNTHYNEIVANYIGVGPNGTTAMGNGTDPAEPDKEGITISAGGQHNLIQGNIVANHPDTGVKISAQDSPLGHSNDTFFNTISQNSIYNNDKGISLVSSSGKTGNQGLPAPQITSASLTTVDGTACNNCLVELFFAQTNDSFDTNDGGEGKTYIGQSTANGSGNFSITGLSLSEGDLLTATATDALGNTSEFGSNVQATLGQKPIGTVLLNGGTGLETPYNDVLAQFSAQDNVAVTEWQYSVDSDINGAGWTPISPPTTPFSTQIDPLTLGYGSHTVYARYKDGDDNLSTVYNATITIVDIGDPGNPANGAIIINDGDAYTNNSDLSLKLIGPPPPFYTKDMKVGEDSLSGISWEPYAVNQSWALDGPPSNSTLVTMVARFRDENNTQTPSTVNDTILFDPVAPTVSVSLNINTHVLDLSGSQDDPGGSGLYQMRIYDAGNHDSGWIAYQASYIWPGPEGTIINVKLKDNAGNESAVSSVGLPIAGPPTGSILLDGGSLQSASNDVVAQFDAVDDSAVAKWRYSIDSNINGVGWTDITPPVSPFSTSENLSLEDGFHTVYVQYMDDGDNTSAVYSASIYIGESLPGIYLPIIIR